MMFVFSVCSFAQSNFGVEGSIGFGRNGGELVNSILMDGRLTFNEYLSSSLGIGLWNSGYKNSWKEGDETNFTIRHLSDGKALPTIQLGLKANVKLFEIQHKPIAFFAEPKLYFLPFSGRTSNLNEVYYTIDPVESALSGENVYDISGTALYHFKSASKPALYYGIQAGVTTILDKSMSVGIGLGYTNLDLFKDLRDKTLHGVALNTHLPEKGLTTLFITFSYLITEY